MPEQVKEIKAIERILGARIERLPMPTDLPVIQHAPQSSSSGRGRRYGRGSSRNRGGGGRDQSRGQSRGGGGGQSRGRQSRRKQSYYK